MKCILLVDDDLLGRQVLRAILEKEGYVCHEAENGAEALKILEIIQFDLIITDQTMPVMDGLKLLQCLQNGFHTRETPAILVTGNLSEQVYQAAVAAGACAVFAKPYSQQTLLSGISQILTP